MFHLYILYSAKRDRYYIGSTKNIDDRLRRHNSGKSISTKSGLPWELVYSRSFDTLSHARKAESKLKRFKSRSILVQLINNDITIDDLMCRPDFG